MRYAQRAGRPLPGSGGVSCCGLQAAERFARGHGISQIAHDLRVTEGLVSDGTGPGGTAGPGHCGAKVKAPRSVRAAGRAPARRDCPSR
jgi:hypothetical protein